MMEASPVSSSLSLSRGGDPTFNSFTPGSHRRSHPNLHHLSFAPLTPKYPISASDYDAYIDPSTNSLHTSTYLSHTVSLPSPEGLLSGPHTPSGTRSPRRLSRRVQSNIHLDNVGTLASPSIPFGAVTSAGLGGQFRRSTGHGHGHRKSHSSISDPSWLIQTGLLLTDSSRESKGQSWLSKRESSTSLISSPAMTATTNQSGYFTPIGGNDNGTQHESRSIRATPSSSRHHSHVRSSGGISRRELRMTSLPATDPSSTPHHKMHIQPNWTDPADQAEALASLDSRSKRSSQDDISDSEDDDEEAEPDSETEQEAEQEITQQMKAGRGFIFGRWVDGIVDTLLMLEDDEEESDSETSGNTKNVKGSSLLQKGTEVADGDDGEATPKIEHYRHHAQFAQQPPPPLESSISATSSDLNIPQASENPKSVWEDVKYAGRLIFGTPVF